MIRNIYLKGELGKLFGEKWRLAAETVAECMHGIDVQRDNKLKEYLMTAHENGIVFTVQRGEEFLDYENLQMELGEDDLIITPVPAGSANKLLKVIVGFALLVTGAWVATLALGATTTLGTIGYLAGATALTMVGSVLLNSGVAEYMAPKKPGDATDSFLFDGPANNVKEGLPVPLAYGQVLVGGSTISFGFTNAMSTYPGFVFESGSNVSYPSSTYPYQSWVPTISENTTPTGVKPQSPLSINFVP